MMEQGILSLKCFVGFSVIHLALQCLWCNIVILMHKDMVFGILYLIIQYKYIDTYLWKFYRNTIKTQYDIKQWNKL